MWEVWSVMNIEPKFYFSGVLNEKIYRIKMGKGGEGVRGICL